MYFYTIKPCTSREHSYCSYCLLKMTLGLLTTILTLKSGLSSSCPLLHYKIKLCIWLSSSYCLLARLRISKSDCRCWAYLFKLLQAAGGARQRLFCCLSVFVASSWRRADDRREERGEERETVRRSAPTPAAPPASAPPPASKDRERDGEKEKGSWKTEKEREPLRRTKNETDEEGWTTVRR